MSVGDRQYRRMFMGALTGVNDNELILNSAYSEIPEVHWCRGCPYGTNLTYVIMCPFVEGSCARIPQTILEPDKELVERVKQFYIKRYAGRSTAGNIPEKLAEKIILDMEAAEETARMDAEEARQRREAALALEKEQMGRCGNAALYEMDGEKHTLTIWSEILGINKHTLASRMRVGMSFEEAAHAEKGAHYTNRNKRKAEAPAVQGESNGYQSGQDAIQMEEARQISRKQRE